MRPDVTFFDPYPDAFGGAQMVTLGLTGEFLRRGLSVTLLSTGEGEATRRAAGHGIRVEVVELPAALSVYGHRTRGAAARRAGAAMPLAWARIASRLRPRPLVLHAIDLRGVLLAGPPARALGVPVVAHLHSTEPAPSLNRVAAALSSRAVVPSGPALAELPAALTRKTTVIPGGIADAVFDFPQARFEKPLVVCAARLAEAKGLDVLVEAAALLRFGVPGLRVQVFGPTQGGWESYADDVHRRIAESNLDDCVELCGFVDQPAKRWAQASVYVQPSRKEPLGLGALEAMAIGLPVVASAVGGLTEIVEHGETGLLVPPGDPDALSRALAELLTDRDRARRMGAAARKSVAGRFTVAAMADSIQALYAAVK